MVYTAAAPLAVVALEPDADGLRTAAARAVRACRGGGTVAWALDASLPHPRRRAGAHAGRGRRHRRLRRPPLAQRLRSRAGVERFVICGCGDELAPVAERAALVARWTNVARELVDAPPNVVSPAGLAERAAAFPGLRAEHHRPHGRRARCARRRRREQPGPAAAPRAPARAGRCAGCAAARARRQGRHVRHGRLLPEAAVGHRPPEGRHGRRRGRRGGAGRDRRARAPAVGHRASCRPARTC